MVKNLADAKAACEALRCDVYSPPMDIDMPGVGRCASVLVRNPGSGALQQIVQVN
jgi:hypothetical protein